MTPRHHLAAPAALVLSALVLVGCEGLVSEASPLGELGAGGGMGPVRFDDAGNGDAGHLDAGGDERGDDDAGATDAGVAHADAGATDAGVVDAGALDAGAGDGGAVDAGVDAGWVVDPDSLRAFTSPALPQVGAAVSASALVADPLYRAAMAREVGTVVPENAMKWSEVHPTPNGWRFGDADALLAFAAQHRQTVVGHTLVWHEQLPAWVSALGTPAALGAALDDHVATLVGRYRGRISSWDVVNEAIDDAGGLRRSPFSDTLGEAFIDRAFFAARAADPGAKRFYNDYGIEGPGPKTDAVVALLQRLKSRGVPVDGVGLQFHLSAYDVARFAVTERTVRDTIARFAALGLEVHVSELDVRLRELRGTTAEKLAFQREVYRMVTAACRLEPGCTAVRTWGLSDRYSWVDARFGPDDPLPLDDAHARKPAYAGLRDGLGAASAATPDFGVGTACGRSVLGAAECEPFESAEPTAAWFRVSTNGLVRLSTARAAMGAQSLEAQVSASTRSEAFVGRAVFSQVSSGPLHVRARVWVAPQSLAPGHVLTVFGVGESSPPYGGVAFGLAGDQVQLSMTTAGQYPSSTGYRFPTGSWQCVQLSVDVSDVQGSASIRVGPTTVVSASGVDTRPAQGHTNLLAGVVYASPNHPGAQVWVDELVASRSPLPCP